MPCTDFVTDSQIYNRMILDEVPNAKTYLWVATADIKDMHVAKGRRMVPFLEILADLVDNRVNIRLIHAKEPGPLFRRDFDKYPNLIQGVERILCPRVHFKCVVVDGCIAYTGSANLTGAGMGAKSDRKRNFENGIITTDPDLIGRIMEQFDSIWMGSRCDECGRKQFCADCKDVSGG